MPKRYRILVGFAFGAALLTGAADPSAALPAVTNGAVLTQDRSDGVIVVRAGGKNRNVNVNRNVNRNTNINRNVNRNANVNVRKNTNVNVNVRRPVRVWAPRPYYGTIVAGVALGTVIYVAAAGTPPAAPSSTLCWYWTDPAMTGGYWDYCR
ncbi:hypothetical protein [Rhodopseudomonas pseudopalustris]|uniref:Uncharacterized protein n=2 Tax=Rhodopseudomonas TaxID=1073 RepID=Q137I6_RHOPS|nr:hypothetical protein [Rhodopseudomonas pseudopalustris]ABE39753.1 hypothetical protein RPD_2523 [Rhodopseudomonas palustris BisB5]SEP21940.1 hypothetical protein SAMN05444123_110155 [Rhodopseudomonas pseudopalustris]